MANKLLKTRMQQKIDTSQNWAKATNFVPLKGEICIYSDLHRMKVGDGTSKIGELDFFETVASSTTLGSIKADAKTETDTVPARIDTDGKLWVNVPDAPLIVTVTNVENNTGTVDYSSSEILAAVSAGREVYLRGSINDLALVFAFGGTFQGQPFFYNIFNTAFASGIMFATVNGNQVYANDAGFVTSDDLNVFKNTIESQLLPNVTASDNDKILKVVNGAWTASASALDKNYFLVNLTPSGETGTVATADKTISEILAAYNNGQIPIARYAVYFLSFVLLDGNNVGFSAVGSLTGKEQTNIIVMSINETSYTVLTLTDESFTDAEIETFYNANA